MPEMLDEKMLMVLYKDDPNMLDELMHYGVGHGDNPPGPGTPGNWGQGEHAYQRVKNFIGHVENLKKYNRLTEEDIALFMGYSNVEQFRKRYLYEKEYAGNPNKFCSYVDALKAEKNEKGKRKYSDAEVAAMVGVRDAAALEDQYKYHQAVWEKFPNGYKIDSEFDRQIKALKDEGYSQAQIAMGLGITTGSLKARESIATNITKREFLEKNRELMEGVKDADGNWIREPITNRSVRARILGVSEPTLRSREKGSVDENSKIIFDTADKLREFMQDHKYLYVGKGTAQRIGVKNDRLNTAVEILKLEGYDTLKVQVDQMGSKAGNKTTMLTLVPPGTTYQQLKNDVANIDNVISIYNGDRYDRDSDTFKKIEEPVSIDSKRIFIKYAEDGGAEKDGLIELRRGVDDLSLGKAAYAQVRIAVDDNLYIKGMAMHTDNVPEGYDILVNSNKKAGTPLDKVLKKFDPKKKVEGNPFGSAIRLDPEEGYIIQRHYIDSKTGEKKLSAINVVNAEGDWADWSKKVASQMLAKQSTDLVKKQLDLTYDSRLKEFEEINSLTNPVVRKKLLDDFEQNADKAAVDLKTVPFTGQSTRVLLPYPKLSEKECYCPGYEDGETVALVRYPHGGTFEIPLLKVNNKFKEAKKDLGNCQDAIGINTRTAAVLSGADFDGDTVICIPVRDKNGNKITSVKTFEDLPEDVAKPFLKLREFDTKTYKLPDDVVNDPVTGERRHDPRVMYDEKARGKQMGVATNLIADITAKGASSKDVIDAVMYSMVVVDAYKHGLDWKKAREDFRIKEINNLYRSTGGSDTIMTKAKSPVFDYPKKEKSKSKMTPEELERYYNGEKVYEEIVPKLVKWRDKDTGELIVREKWPKKEQTYRMAQADTPEKVRNLMSKTPTDIERLYADFAIKMKELAQKARKESRLIKMYSKNTDPETKAKYKDEVKSLQDQKNRALSLKPLENKAQAYANRLFDKFKNNNPNLDEGEYKKQKGRMIERARNLVGVKQVKIDISDKEWEAIQSGVISASDVKSILDYADMDKVRKLAMPKTASEIPVAKIQYAENKLRNTDAGVETIAQELGVSVSTLYDLIDIPEIRHQSIEERNSYNVL